MKPKFQQLYMGLAQRIAQMSVANRLQVGAVVVKDDIVIIGYNGTPAGWDNTCEDRVYMDADAGGWLDPETIALQWPFIEYIGEEDTEARRYTLVTKPEVLHAERNALDKLAKSTESGKGAVMFVTHAPCLECAKSIYGTGIKEVFYGIQYRNLNGVEFLEKCGIAVTQLKVA
jgi:dCMP deaminase